MQIRYELALVRFSQWMTLSFLMSLALPIAAHANDTEAQARPNARTESLVDVLDTSSAVLGPAYEAWVVQEHRRDSIWNGAAIGAAIGGTSMVLLVNVPCQNEGGGCSLQGYALAFGIGAAAGMGVGALVDAALHVSPIVTDGRRGAQVSLRW